MMAHYGIPHSGTSGSGTGWNADLTAAGPLWLNHLTSCLCKVGLVPFVGGNFDSLVFSPTTVVYSDKVIRQLRQFVKGFRLDDEKVAIEEIASIGPGGNYLTSTQTLKLFKKFLFDDSIWAALSLEQWQAKSMPQADELLKKHTCELIKDLQALKDHNMLIKEGV